MYILMYVLIACNPSYTECSAMYVYEYEQALPRQTERLVF